MANRTFCSKAPKGPGPLESAKNVAKRNSWRTQYSFLGCEKEKLCLKRSVKWQKLCFTKGAKRQKGCEMAKTLSHKGCEKAKTLSQKGREKAKSVYIILH